MSDPQDISVRVLDDGRRAEVHIPLGVDPAHLTPALLSTIAGGAKVQQTADLQQRLAAVVKDYIANPRDLVVDIAHAVPPINGTSGTWAWEPRFDPAQRPQADAAGSQAADHHVSQILTVVAGTPIARTTPPTEGTDGRTVTGAVIASRRGSAAKITAGKGLEVQPNGVVAAKTDGVLNISKGVATVSSVLNVAGSVDFSTGNIDFKGDVLVAEGVRDGFHIRATGDITIKGAVEGATIDALAGLTCPSGIASARRAKIVVGGNSNIGFLRNVSAIFRGDLTCRGEIEQSDIIVGGEFHGESGRIVGGRLVLTGLAHVGAIGSSGWAPTVVCVGDLPLIAIELRRLTADLIRNHAVIAAKQDAVRQIEQMGGKSASAREKLTEFQFELSELVREAATIEAQKSRLLGSATQSQGSELHVLRTVYPHARVQHANTAYEFRTELKGPLQFLCDSNGMIQVRVSSKDPRPITDFAHTVAPTPIETPEPAKKAA